MAHLTGFGLENFRVFNEETWFDFAPITVLTGPNNSGKSSLTHAVMLQKETIDSKKLTFDKEFGGILGNFSIVKSINSKNALISFYTPFYFRELLFAVKRNYRIDKESPFKEGILDSIEIINKSKTENKIIFTQKYDEKKHIFWHIKIDFHFFRGLFEQLAREKYNNFIKCDIDGLSLLFLQKSFSEATEGSFVAPSSQDLVPDDIDHKIYFHKEIDDSFQEKIEYFNFNAPLLNLGEKAYNYNSIIEFWESLKKKKRDELDLKILDDKKNEIKDLYSFKHPSKSASNLKELIIKELDLLSEFSFSSSIIDKYDSIDSPSLKQILYMNLLDSNINNLRSNFQFNNFEEIESEVLKFSNIDVFFDILIKFIDNSKSISFFNSVNRINANRGLIRRTYTFNEKSTFKEIMYEFVNRKSKLIEVCNSFIEKWLRIFDIGGKLCLELNGNGENFEIKIGDKHLADSGYAINQLIPMLIAIINNFKRNHYDWYSHGAGDEYFEPSTLMIEEPEANLHPNFQSKIADMFIDAAKKFNIQFIIETHSEYLIRKLQYLTAKGEIKPEDSIIYYFHHPDHIPKGQKQVKRIDILEDGSLSDNFGPGFFDEALNLKFELLRLKNQKN